MMRLGTKVHEVKLLCLYPLRAVAHELADSSFQPVLFQKLHDKILEVRAVT